MEIALNRVQNWDLYAPQTEEEAGESQEAISLEIANSRNITIANWHAYRVTRTVRPIMCEAGLLPRVHGSALFQRGETQAIVTTTLGTSSDEQKIDGLMGETWKRFYLHYNFPPFSTGETKPMRGPGRREIGHGALAERALSRMIPPPDQFPYTIRIVSETLESNGSSSMT